MYNNFPLLQPINNSANERINILEKLSKEQIQEYKEAFQLYDKGEDFKTNLMQEEKPLLTCVDMK